ncbi:MAG: sigma 54-interacting transcriptional regulator [Dehalobacterium sp.]
MSRVENKILKNYNDVINQQNQPAEFEGSILDYVLQGVNEAIIIIDSSGGIIKHNKAILEILNLSQENLLGSLLSDLIPGFSLTAFDIIDLKVDSSFKKLIVRQSTCTINSEVYHIIFISTLDSSQLELARQFKEIKMVKEMYEKIINSIEEGIHSIDLNGNIIIYNSAQEKLEGYRASDVLGKHVTEIYNLDKTSSLLLRVLEEGRPILDYHQEYTTKNGKYIDVLCSTVPIYSGNKIVGSTAILKDFSAFRQMAERMLYLQEKLTVKWSKTTSVQKKGSRITFNNLIGSNKQFLESIKWAKAAANTDSPILIFGETGTGKELFAQSIHEESNRSHGSFLAINCAAIPENLLEGILFGTVKGAFTGAINRTGLLEQASGGSLFLDEINSMPITLQAKLLRVLEEKKVRRLGGHEEVPIDTRIISSCNIHPTMAIDQGQIRADLFYRLAVVYVCLPPLRDRLDDLELLSSYFIQSLNKQLNKCVSDLDPDLLLAFKNYHWPGNIRQLKHTIECAMNIIPDEEKYISMEYIPQYLGLFSQEKPQPEKEYRTEKKLSNRVQPQSKDILNQIKSQEKEAIIAALVKSKGNVAKAATDLNMSRQLLQYHLKKLGLK